jgi:hypothetical protein
MLVGTRRNWRVASRGPSADDLPVMHGSVTHRRQTTADIDRPFCYEGLTWLSPTTCYDAVRPVAWLGLICEFPLRRISAALAAKLSC